MATTGLVIGKFLPPHKGHQYLIDMASNYCDNVNVLVGSLEREPIPGKVRYEALKKFYASNSNISIFHQKEELPQDPSEDPDFWNIWYNSILSYIKNYPDYVFASEEYGFKLAEIFGARFIPVDINRNEIDISATRIRSDIWNYWDYIIPTIRPYFLKKIVIFGPESTGKTTLTKKLAETYDTIYVSEYIRKILDQTGIEPDSDGLLLHAKGHLACSKALENQANRILFYDTDLLTTTIWAKWLGKKCDKFIIDNSKEKYDLTLLMYPDCEWINDGTRYYGENEQRIRFFDDCMNELERHGRRYVIIKGKNWEDRYNNAVHEVDKFIRNEFSSISKYKNL